MKNFVKHEKFEPFREGLRETSKITGDFVGEIKITLLNSDQSTSNETNDTWIGLTNLWYLEESELNLISFNIQYLTYILYKILKENFQKGIIDLVDGNNGRNIEVCTKRQRGLYVVPGGLIFPKTEN